MVIDYYKQRQNDYQLLDETTVMVGRDNRSSSLQADSQPKLVCHHGSTIKHCCEYYITIIIFLGPTSTKPQAEILKLNNVNGCNDISFGDHSILEGDRIIIIIIIIIIITQGDRSPL